MYIWVVLMGTSPKVGNSRNSSCTFSEMVLQMSFPPLATAGYRCQVRCSFFFTFVLVAWAFILFRFLFVSPILQAPTIPMSSFPFLDCVFLEEVLTFIKSFLWPLRRGSRVKRICHSHAFVHIFTTPTQCNLQFNDFLNKNTNLWANGKWVM